MEDDYKDPKIRGEMQVVLNDGKEFTERLRGIGVDTCEKEELQCEFVDAKIEVDFDQRCGIFLE